MAEDITGGMELVVLEGKVFDVIGVNDAKIAQAIEKYGELTVKDINDKIGLAAVHEGRMVFKGMRVMVEKYAKKVREKAVKFQKDVITEEKRVVGLIQVGEDHLADQENRITEEIASIKAEAAAIVAAKILDRQNLLFKMGCRLLDGVTFSYSGVAVAEKNKVVIATDDQFAALVQSLQEVLDEEAAEKAEAEKKRLEEQAIILKIQQEQEAERQRLEAEQAKIKQERKAAEKELAEAQAKLKAQQEELAADKQKLIDEENERIAVADRERLRVLKEAERAEELAKAKEEEKLKARQETLDVLAQQEEELGAAYATAGVDIMTLPDEKWYAICDARRALIRTLLEEKAMAEAEERIKKETAEKAAKAKKEAAEKVAREAAARIRAEKKEARRPDKTKLLGYIDTINNTPVPELKTEEGKAVQEKVRLALEASLTSMIAWVEEL